MLTTEQIEAEVLEIIPKRQNFIDIYSAGDGPGTKSYWALGRLLNDWANMHFNAETRQYDDCVSAQQQEVMETIIRLVTT